MMQLRTNKGDQEGAANKVGGEPGRDGARRGGWDKPYPVVLVGQGRGRLSAAHWIYSRKAFEVLDRSCCSGMMEPKLMEVGSRENGKRGSRASRYKQLWIEVSL